jgi:hypothetical protein
MAILLGNIPIDNAPDGASVRAPAYGVFLLGSFAVRLLESIIIAMLARASSRAGPFHISDSSDSTKGTSLRGVPLSSPVRSCRVDRRGTRVDRPAGRCVR